MCYVVQISSGSGPFGVIDKDLDEEWFPALSSVASLDLVHHTID